jgi:DNA-binding NtrC family response regulator
VPSTSDSARSRSLPLKSIAKDAIRELERNVILEALRSNQWNRRKTAQALKISYRALIYKIRDQGLMEIAEPPAPLNQDISRSTGSKIGRGC